MKEKRLIRGSRFKALWRKKEAPQLGEIRKGQLVMGAERKVLHAIDRSRDTPFAKGQSFGRREIKGLQILPEHRITMLLSPISPTEEGRRP